MYNPEFIQDIKRNGIAPEHIEKLIDLHSDDRFRMMNSYSRYKEDVDVVPIFKHDPIKEYEDFETGGNVKRVDQYVNNKLNNAFDAEIIDTRVGYLHGVPISYTTDDKRQKEVIDEFNLMNTVEDLDSELGKMAAICGYAARLIYIDKTGSARVRNIKPFNVVFIGDDITEPTYSLYYYKTVDDKGKESYYCEFYDDAYYYVYTGDKDALVFQYRQEHLSDFNPLYGVANNEELIGDVERVRHLIDGYNRTLSDASSEISQTRLAYLVLKGLGLEEGEIQDLKQSGVFELFDERQDVKYLTKDINDTMIENHLDRLEKNIMRFAKSVNFNSDEFNGNVPVIGMRLKLMALENKCMTFERKMTAMLRYQFKVLFSIWKRRNKVSVKDTDYLYVKFSFGRNVPVNKLEEAQILSTLNGQVSDVTRYAQSSLVENPEEEIALMNAEGVVMDNEESEGN
ncbi:phage portal protein [Staphylococcus simulans]|uniref:phage portal protein n=1 Tax=Staphylococcus simulans TaxID=1286 RepID=UPI0021CEC1BC|nr:phage portal protein [Staphylococcus simulans]UXR29361.1 phage portal protein [Staphylococcus simulans]